MIDWLVTTELLPQNKLEINWRSVFVSLGCSTTNHYHKPNTSIGNRGRLNKGVSFAFCSFSMRRSEQKGHQAMWSYFREAKKRTVSAGNMKLKGYIFL